MGLLDHTTQKNSTTSEETAELARLLDGQGEILRNSIIDLEKRVGISQSNN